MVRTPPRLLLAAAPLTLLLGGWQLAPAEQHDAETTKPADGIAYTEETPKPERIDRTDNPDELYDPHEIDQLERPDGNGESAVPETTENTSGDEGADRPGGSYDPNEIDRPGEGQSSGEEQSSGNDQPSGEAERPGNTAEPGDTAKPGEASDLDKVERILRLTNEARGRADCPDLRLNETLNDAARRHSTQMARQDYLGHRSADGADHINRAKRAGYPSVYVGENVAAGNADAAKTFRQWMNSPEHRRNILNCSFTELGVGYASDRDSRWTHYWTQMFGKTDSAE
ncbi:Cysteine-rich secretory protein family protein [Actinopolyspora mzabensis]|uniref:Cysteine-rich secretory protein family protein n=1 Tax=Actinopolyspora mzabensis TaxID=995066 RepID=A0A1G8VYB1_ACTMZ|nr:CAP domain-containing protein [Actinopolyspora mzabensis]SDJ71032.1 Cysteine-rich secretory protein family protein [Actinopolyspora mzabensis]